MFGFHDSNDDSGEGAIHDKAVKYGNIQLELSGSRGFPEGGVFIGYVTPTAYGESG